MNDVEVSTEVHAGAGRNRLAAIAGPILSVGAFCVALWFLHRELAGVSTTEVVAEMRSIPNSALLLSFCAAACSYFVLTLNDATAMRYMEKTVGYGRTAVTAFMAYAVGHNVGLVALSGGAIRYRMYSLAGLSATDIATLVLFATLTFGLGASALLGTALVLMPASQTALLGLPHGIVTAVGLLMALIPIIYLGLSLLRRAPLQLGNWKIPIPKPTIALSQLAVSVTDLAFAAATLYVLLAPNLEIGYLPFLGIFLLAIGAGLVSSVPGGIGVFEATMVATLPQVDSAVLLGTILVYRIFYYLVPLTVALLLLGLHESRQHGDIVSRSTASARKWLSAVAPQVLGTAVFLAGVVLLVSGASPAAATRLHLIGDYLPLPVLELSHLVGSVVGVGLLILARGLFKQLHGAYYFAVIALSLGIGMSLLKGLDYEEALVLAVVLAVLWSARGEFERKGSIVSAQFPVRWIATIVIAIGFATWIGLVNFRHVEYSNELWWQFAFNAEAPRALRASVVVAVAASGFALWHLLRLASPGTLPVTAEVELEMARDVIAKSTRSASNVALLGDKRFLWSADRQAFIMYQVSGDSWIAMGDPVGDDSYHRDLAWDFRELVDHYSGRLVFYEVSDRALPLYVDMGLTLAKIGEEARVSLDGFSLRGGQWAELRYALNHAKKQGASFDIVPRNAVPSMMDDLQRVSDRWLNDKATGEKGFSLGSFSAGYIANFDCAVVRRNGAVIAFANLWPAPAGGELSIDLMRFDPGAPNGTMDYLFVELMLWGAANGYRWFSLGMAPLSGLQNHPLAPLWDRIGHLVFSHGESFYNFEGLRQYKEKFHPEWQPSYIACRGGWTRLPLALLDVARLISGGAFGIIAR